MSPADHWHTAPFKARALRVQPTDPVSPGQQAPSVPVSVAVAPAPPLQAKLLQLETPVQLTAALQGLSESSAYLTGKTDAISEIVEVFVPA